MEEARRKQAVIIHCAGVVSIATEDPALWKVNVDGTRNVVDLCEAYGIPKLVCVSSVHALPEMEQGTVVKETNHFSASLVHGVYGKSKAEAAAYVKKATERGLSAVLVHPSGLIGPEDYSQGYMTEMIRLYARHGFPASIEGGYDFADVRDVVQGIIYSANRDVNGEYFILSNEYITVKRLVDILAELTGKRKVYGNIPLKWVKGLAPLCEKMTKHFDLPGLINPYSIYTLGSNGYFSHEKADSQLDYHVRPIEETLADIICWMEKI